RPAQSIDRCMAGADVETLRLAQLDDRLLRDAAVAALGFTPKLGVEVVREISDLKDGHGRVRMRYACIMHAVIPPFKLSAVAPPSQRNKGRQPAAFSAIEEWWAEAHPYFFFGT